MSSSWTMDRPMGPLSTPARPAPSVIELAATRERDARSGPASHTCSNKEFTHVLLLDGDMQHLPDEASQLLDAARRTGADLVVGERQFSRDRMPPSRYYANRLGSAVLSWFVGASLADTQCGFRVFRTDALQSLSLTALRLRDRNGDADQGAATARAASPACR